LTNRDIVEKLRNLIKEIQSREAALGKNSFEPSLEKPSLTGGFLVDSSCVSGEDTCSQSEPEILRPSRKPEIIEKEGYCVYTTVYTAGSLPWFYPPPLETVVLLTGEENPGAIVDALSLNQTLFLDLETTGLLGAGTVSFLTGLGRWKKDEFHVLQFLLSERDCEATMLEELARELEGSRVLVTFNGKAFDMPVIRNRFIMNGLIHDFHDFDSHIDLFSLVRKLGKHPVYGLSLTESVKRFIGTSRVDDIPGHMIPALYFIYEQDKDISILEPVLEHNLLDILDMVGLLRVLGLTFSGKHRPYGDASALAGVGRFHLSRGGLELARQCLGTSLACFEDRPAHDKRRFKNMRLLATVMRKQGDWDAAAGIWNHLISRGVAVVDDYLWLARHYELHENDIMKSLNLVNQCADWLKESKYPVSNAVMSRKRRLERIISKMALGL
jgi:uncharacterized protein YprB with RNaseH-like and TPR domain